jgi:hypothetical protein
MFLGRLFMFILIVAGLAFAALLALGSVVEPEQREMSITLPMPKPKGQDSGG